MLKVGSQEQRKCSSLRPFLAEMVNVDACFNNVYKRMFCTAGIQTWSSDHSRTMIFCKLAFQKNAQ